MKLPDLSKGLDRHFMEKGLVTQVTENFKLKSLILAQIERWRHA